LLAALQYAAFEDDDRIYLVLEYAAGVRLSQGPGGFVRQTQDHRHSVPSKAASAESLKLDEFDTRHVLPPPIPYTLPPQGDLFDEVKRRGGRLKEVEVVRGVLHPYLSALAYLHEWGIIHRDIKPENTVFSRDKARGARRSMARYMSLVPETSACVHV
jgi:serine/threonine protein kinase